ncbi:MAG TPA: ATP-binding protein [Ottowia sp.]|uniref:ATP-binding protein n=1 Tax=Ottowia sp. TaxID=1898956 RepID=UPI002D0390CE|nr:ATP-binding protein [Ottowia sp.]HMN22190.1 ATP-binding protein [Ottowia sp.]
MLNASLVLGASVCYLLLLYAIAWLGDRQAARGRSLIANPWVYALSISVYCTAWTYFGSVGRASTGGIWFLPIYLGPTLAMVLGWLVLRKMVRIAKVNRITSIADFIASRYGKSRLLSGLVTLMAVVGIVPYIALQLKAVAGGYALLLGGDAAGAGTPLAWLGDGTFYVTLLLAGFAMMFGARHLDPMERHEGMVAAIAFESLVKLLAFLAVGIFVTWGLFDGFADITARAQARPELAALLTLEQGAPFDWPQWFATTLLAMLALLMLPRQFQVMVVENVRESHLRRAAWVFPLYLLLINLFVLPIALGGLLYFEGRAIDAENLVLSLPLATGHGALALLVFIGGLSAATGMVIVETIACSVMVSNELVMPLLLRTRAWRGGGGGDAARVLLNIRRAVILGMLLLGYAYFQLAGSGYALVSIGLISFAAVAQFAPAALGGMYWRGATRLGALWGLLGGFALWAYTLMLPAFAKSGWLDAGFVTHGPWDIALLRPEQLLGLQGLDPLTHALFWSLLANLGLYVGLSLWRPPSAAETSQAQQFVGVYQQAPVFWRGRARLVDLRGLCERFLGSERTAALLADYAQHAGAAGADAIEADAHFVHFIETQLAGVVGSASARALVASVAEEDVLTPDDVLRMLEEASQLRAYSRELEDKQRSLEEATAQLREANEQLQGLDRLKDDFMSSVTHELRTPLTSIRALSELILDADDMEPEQQRRFVAIIAEESERLSRLVNQVLDLAKIESGGIEWDDGEVDLRAVVDSALAATAELFREAGCAVHAQLPERVRPLHADGDRLKQVVLNLLSNAAKFVPRPGGQVAVALAEDAAGLTVTVRDNGPGIAPADQPHVFEKFRQVGDTRKHTQGTGLGLPISREIVEHYGGRIWVESTPGAGACFGFHLPWQAAAALPPEETQA